MVAKVVFYTQSTKKLAKITTKNIKMQCGRTDEQKQLYTLNQTIHKNFKIIK